MIFYCTILLVTINMTSLSSPFENDRDGVLRLAILNGKYQIPTPVKLPSPALNSSKSKSTSSRVLSLSPTVKDVLLHRMLQVDCKQRPFMQEISHICDGLLQSAGDSAA